MNADIIICQELKHNRVVAFKYIFIVFCLGGHHVSMQDLPKNYLITYLKLLFTAI